MTFSTNLRANKFNLIKGIALCFLLLFIANTSISILNGIFIMYFQMTDIFFNTVYPNIIEPIGFGIIILFFLFQGKNLNFINKKILSPYTIIGIGLTLILFSQILSIIHRIFIMGSGMQTGNIFEITLLVTMSVFIMFYISQTSQVNVIGICIANIVFTSLLVIFLSSWQLDITLSNISIVVISSVVTSLVPLIIALNLFFINKYINMKRCSK